MSLYLDASALTKLVIEEQYSAALGGLVKDRAVASSELSIVEVPRAVRRRARGVDRIMLDRMLELAVEVLSRVTLLPLERPTLETAGRISEPHIRALDAIHIATALTAGDDLSGFVTYDRQQGRAASLAGFEVLAPGA